MTISDKDLSVKPASAPEAPTVTLVWINNDENKLPTNPDIIYNNPTRTAKQLAI
jgi:hypothetical protein